MKFKYYSVLILSLFSIYSSCSKEESAIKEEVKVVEGSYTWLYDFSGISNDIALVAKIKKSGVKNIFMSLSTNLLLPSGSSKQAGYTNKFKKILDQLEANGIKVHAIVLNDHEYTFTYMHKYAVERIEVFNSFCRANPKYLGHPLLGIHIDVEPHATDDWHSAKTYGAKEYIMKQYIGLLTDIKPHMSIKTGTSEYTFLLSAAIAGWYDELSKRGDLPSGDPNNLGKYLDILVPMIYFDGSETGYSVQQKISLLKQRAVGEINQVNTVIGINIGDFKTVGDVNSVITEVNKFYDAKPNYKGLCYFTFKSYCSKIGVN